MLGSRRQDFSAELCVAGAGSGPPSAVLRQPFKPFQLHLHLCIIRAAEATAVTQWLFASNFLAILLPGKENFSLSSLHRVANCVRCLRCNDSDYAHEAYQTISLFLSVF